MKDFDFKFYSFSQYISLCNSTEDFTPQDEINLKKTVCDLLQTSFDKIHVLDENIDEDINEVMDFSESNMQKLNEIMIIDESVTPIFYEDSGSSGTLYSVKIGNNKALSYNVMGFQTIFIAE